MNDPEFLKAQSGDSVLLRGVYCEVLSFVGGQETPKLLRFFKSKR